ncbi:MAG: molybdopterin cofactor-binding domain-containing protein, partial [Myxococcota bacterium]
RHIFMPHFMTFFRAPGTSSNAFVCESFMDELAALAGTDPVEFRLAHLGSDPLNERMRRALVAVREDSGWDRPMRAGHARGVAVYAYGNAVCAMVIEVEQVDARVEVRRVFVCCEAGRLVNLDVSGSQVEGGVALGLSWAVYEHSKLADGIVENATLTGYHMMPPREAPDTVVRFLQEDEFRQGLNEIPPGLVAPALGNALYALTGVRQRELPLELQIAADA